MKILYIVKCFSDTSGGVENHLYNLIRTLKGKHEITVITSNLYDFSMKDVRIINLPVSFKFMNYIYSRDLKKILKHEIQKHDIIHAHSYCCYFVDTVVRIAKRMGKKVVITNHGIFPSKNFITAIMMYIYNLLIGRKTLKSADKIICVSKFSMKKMNRIYPIKGKSAIIPNGISLDEFKHPKKLESFSNLPKKDLTNSLFYAGRIVPEKGLMFLVKAFVKNLKEYYADRFLLIAGDDTTQYAAEVKKYVKNERMEKNIIFLGKLARQKLVSFYSVVKGFVIPSAYEPFGIVILEAMVSGLPVISSKVGGATEILSGTPNKLIEYNNISELASAISWLYSLNPQEYHEISLFNKKYASSFSWDVISKTTLEVYKKILCGI